MFHMTVAINTVDLPDNFDRLDFAVETGRVLYASVNYFYNIDEYLPSDIPQYECLVLSQTAIYYDS